MTPTRPALQQFWEGICNLLCINVLTLYCTNFKVGIRITYCVLMRYHAVLFIGMYHTYSIYWVLYSSVLSLGGRTPDKGVLNSMSFIFSLLNI